MTEYLAENIEYAANIAATWGPLLIFFFMALQSSLIPFPSEVVMLPAGFMAIRGELPLGSPVGDSILALFCGVTGCLTGAYFNYGLSVWLGRPILYKYGKHFFLPPHHLERAEEIFREYGDITIFVCQLVPAIRQLISIPAGLSRMKLSRFTFFTGLGAGIWSLILLLIGVYFGLMTSDMTYPDLVHAGKDMLKDNLIWMMLALVVIVVVYIYIHKKVMTVDLPHKTDEV